MLKKPFQRKFKLTERDREILNFINHFGFCEMPHLDKRFELKAPRNYQIMQRLIKAGLVIHERVFHNRPGIFRLTSDGASFTPLPPLKRIVLSHYRHNIILIELFLFFRERYPEAKFLSERVLKKEKFSEGLGVGKHGHLEDGILEFSPEKRIPIEVELTRKGIHRLKSILKRYSRLFEIEEVWYYCTEETADFVRSMAVGIPYVKVFELSEVISSPLVGKSWVVF